MLLFNIYPFHRSTSMNRQYRLVDPLPTCELTPSQTRHRWSSFFISCYHGAIRIFWHVDNISMKVLVCIFATRINFSSKMMVFYMAALDPILATCEEILVALRQFISMFVQVKSQII
ncbi:unnamed protein product [Chrysodeixis includens]|uniref:Uncharacterized protein n=1 Tax=Chrysodeixis includens TaxID=689277 RepID=A0A9N8PZ52_CHRIL|nr:unnamed protein product [Chrysodeixis includens]